MQGLFFVVSVFLQQVRGYTAIQTGLLLTPATIGVLLTAAAASRLARRRSQAILIRAGFVSTAAGMALLLALVREQSSVFSFVPGLFLVGAGVGVMLTSSVNVVQSSFPEADQNDISGLSRSISNLGIVARHGTGRLDPRRRIVPRRQAVRARHHHAPGHRTDRPRARGPHPEAAGSPPAKEPAAPHP